MPDAAIAGPTAVLAFWFGDGLDLGWPSASRSDLWFNGGSTLDQQITAQFGPLVRRHLQSAAEHRDIIARFGRFPYRNAVLGRTGTALEEDFLNNGPRFGQ